MATEGLMPGRPGENKEVVATSAQANFDMNSSSVEIVLVGKNADDMPIKRRSLDLSLSEWQALCGLMTMKPGP